MNEGHIYQAIIPRDTPPDILVDFYPTGRTEGRLVDSEEAEVYEPRSRRDNVLSNQKAIDDAWAAAERASEEAQVANLRGAEACEKAGDAKTEEARAWAEVGKAWAKVRALLKEEPENG